MIPDFLSHLKTFNGLPVPFTQVWIDGKPDFRPVDPAKTMQCVQEKLCAICGGRFGEKSCFIGGPLSKTNRLFTDAQALRGVRCPHLPIRIRQKLDYSDRPLNPAMVKVQEMVSTQRPATMYLLTSWTKKTQLVRHNGSVFIQAGSWIGTRDIP